MTRWRAVLAALGLLLGACVGVGREPPSTTVSVPATAPASATTRPVATTTTVGAPGVIVAASTTTTTTILDSGPVTILEAGPGVPVLVGGVLPFSGRSRRSGVAQADAVQLAVTTFGDIAGHDVLLAPFEDSRCTVDGGRSAARAIVAAGPSVAGSPVVGLIGPACEASAIEAIPLVVDAGFTVISPTITSPEFTSGLTGVSGGLWRRGFFRVAPNDLLVARSTAEFVLEELGAQRPAVVTVAGDPLGATLADVFVETVTAAGAPAVSAVEMPASLRLPRRRLLAMVADEPDVVFLAMDGASATVVLDALATINVFTDVVRVMTQDALMSEAAGLEASEGAFFVILDESPQGRDAVGTRYQDMRVEYERVFGAEPTIAAVRAYDATMLLLTAVASVVEDRDGTLVLDRRRVTDALFSASLQGYSGWLACDDFGDCLEPRVQVLENESPGDLGATLANEVWTG